MKTKTPIILFLIFIIYTLPAVAICCETTESCEIIEQCPSGNCQNCELNFYNKDGTLNHTGSMTEITSKTYSFNLSITNQSLDYGRYAYTINCTSSKNCIGDCEIEIKQDCEELNMGIISMIIGIPLFLAAVFLLLGIFLDKKEHPAMKKFFILLTFVSVFQAYHYGMESVVKFYNFPELQNAIGGGVFNLGMIFYVIIAYFLIDFIVALFRVMAGKRHKTGEDYDL